MVDLSVSDNKSIKQGCSNQQIYRTIEENQGTPRATPEDHAGNCQAGIQRTQTDSQKTLNPGVGKEKMPPYNVGQRGFFFI